MLRVAGYQADFIVERLTRFVHEAGIAGATERYVAAVDVFIPEATVESNPALAKRISDLCGELVSLELPFAASAVLVKSHARILDLKALDGATAKVALAPPEAGRSFFRDRRARRIVADRLTWRGFGVPPILRFDGQRGGWLVEAAVNGRHATAFDMQRFVALHMRDLFGTARSQPTNARSRSSALFERLRGDLLDLHPSYAALRHGRWTVALCHGDLNPDNLLCGVGGQFWLVDWERASVQPVTFDLGRVYVKNPDLKTALLGILRSLDPKREALPAEMQLALGAAFILRKLRQSREGAAGTSPARYIGGRPVAVVDEEIIIAREAIVDLAR